MKVVRTVAGARASRGRGLTLNYATVRFPFGKATVAIDGDALCWIGLGGGVAKIRAFFPRARLVEDRTAVTAAVRGGRVALYGTPFQIAVWKQLLKIVRGRTSTYLQVARAVGRPRALRAVGSAVGANPLSVIVPCHRVINTSGAIDKYAWGPEVKRRLLIDEGAL